MSRPLPSSVLCAVLVCAALGCKPPERSATPAPPAVAPTPEPAAWLDARQKLLAEAAADGPRLLLKHRPAAAQEPAALELVLVSGSAEIVLKELRGISPTARDALWSAPWRLAADPGDGSRYAVSHDGGGRWRAVFVRGLRAVYCPHVTAAAKGDAPDWSALPTLESWLAGVLQTAVWGCPPRWESGCRSRALGRLPLHHSEPGAEPASPSAQVEGALTTPHGIEMKAAVEVAGELAPTRTVAMALVDAALGFQPLLNPEELERLGMLAARALAPGGPLTEDERRALAARIALAREEAKNSESGPSRSLEALRKGLAGVPETVGARPR